MSQKKITHEDIEKFINGRDPFERIVNLKYSYKDKFITVVYRDENDRKKEMKDEFFPFCWATLKACRKLCGGNRDELKSLMAKYSIGVKKLNNTSIDGEVRHEFDNGYLFMFYAKNPMSYRDFVGFFKKAGNPVSSNKTDDGVKSKEDSKQYLIVTPQEQYLISSGKRFFKGYDDYDQLLKMTIDLETTGLDTKKDRIVQIGIRMNRPFKGHPEGFEKLIDIEGESDDELAVCELWALDTLFKIIHAFEPDIITAHNGEAFDWNIIIDACTRLGTSIEEMSSKYFNGESIRKDEKESVLKLGGEIEYYRQTIVPGTIVTDSLHAVRRAQAIDSSMLRADLKYVTEYSKMKKPNRVYVPGKEISTTYKNPNKEFAFNDVNGDWYRYDPSKNDVENKDEPVVAKKNYIPVHGYIKNGYELVSGTYIVERYLKDDLWECDKVEHRYNTPNFLICKMIPVPYKKCTTMGTAGQWKSIMMAWSYENNLAIPMFGDSKKFTGGLSRLLRVGYVKNVVKLDYNSLYPSIILTWAISDPIDLMRVMLDFLEYVLTQREKFKKLKKTAGKNKGKVKAQIEDYDGGEIGLLDLQTALRQYSADESFNDKKQLPMKIFGNSFFGSYGAPDVFPWGSLKCAEQTTCTGRQCLRLMISHFARLGYEPIVGDSFTPDTPLFVKYENSDIDIRPISELIDESSIKIDELGREYDYSRKNYKVLCRSGWVEPFYIYRHKTNKNIYEVSENDMLIEVTEDHSLFDDKKEKISPKNITDSTKIEYYNNEIKSDGKYFIDSNKVENYAIMLSSGEIDKVPVQILNSDSLTMKLFYATFMANYHDDVEYSKSCIAGLGFIRKKFDSK